MFHNNVSNQHLTMYARKHNNYLTTRKNIKQILEAETLSELDIGILTQKI